jgi:hypothetical protein
MQTTPDRREFTPILNPKLKIRNPKLYRGEWDGV